MSKKDELIAQAKSIGIETEGLTVAELTTAINITIDAEEEDEIEQDAEELQPQETNPTVLRQLEAKKARKERAEKLAKAQKENELKKEASKSKSENASDNKAKKDTRKIFTDKRGLKFAFKYTAPKSLNIDGLSCKTSELIENEEVMLELINGNNNYIEQIY